MNCYERRKSKDKKLLLEFNKKMIAYNQGKLPIKPTLLETKPPQVLDGVQSKLEWYYKYPGTSLESQTNRKQFFYILEFENGIKFGRSQDTKHRFLTYTSPWCFPILRKQVYYCPVPDLVEMIFQKHFKSYLTTTSREYLIGIGFSHIFKYSEEIIKLIKDKQNIPPHLLNEKNKSKG